MSELKYNFPEQIFADQYRNWFQDLEEDGGNMNLEREPYIKKSSIFGSFFAGNKPPEKFMALYSDGSGGSMFKTIDGIEGPEMYLDENKEFVDYDWFIDAGYTMWVSLPDIYTIWQEKE